MLEIKITNEQAQCKVVFIKDIKGTQDEALLEKMNFKESFFAQESQVLYMQIKEESPEYLREASAKAVRILKKMPFESARFELCGGKEGVRAILLGAYSGFYEFNTYKTNVEKKAFKQILIECKCPTLEVVLNEVQVISQSLNLVRDLVNTIPNDATPTYLAKIAQEEAQKVGIECKVLEEEQLQEEKMNALLAVSRASSQKPRLIHLTYRPQNPKAKLVFVGKGLTYDSGGLSLKPADFMVTMKADKSGGCAVLGIILAIAKLKLPLEVHSIIGAVENMIGGNAYKPDDVLFSREGKSIEVRNTDAEGRLVLVDCLSYAQDLKPDYLIDLATLTGACVVGLGEYTFGIMGENAELKNSFEAQALKSGELVAQLPFNSHIKKLLDSKIADICNIASSRYGGAISAGMFLGEFIREEYKQKWLHLDIAGPAYVEKEWDINPCGASGAGVRACVEFATFLSKGE